MKNGIIEYFVNDGQKVHGPFDVHPEPELLYSPRDLEELSVKDFKWYLPGMEYDEKSEENWHNTLAELGKIAGEIAKNIPETEYDEKYHIQTINNPDGSTKEQYFVTDSKKYGPYAYIFPAIYKDDNNFQFIFQKELRTSFRKPKPNYYYNYNGKEYKIGKEVPSIYYDINEHAILEQPDLTYILIDGKKKDFFHGVCTNCSIQTDGTHTMIAGKDKDSDSIFHYILDGVKRTIHTRGGQASFENDSVIYLSDHGIWYLNETPISVQIPGVNSKIIGNVVTYENQGIPYIVHKGKTYNGKTGFLNAKTQGFVFFLDGSLLFMKYSYPIFLAPTASEYDKKSSTQILQEIETNIKTLAAEHKLAGE